MFGKKRILAFAHLIITRDGPAEIRTQDLPISDQGYQFRLLKTDAPARLSYGANGRKTIACEYC